MTGSTGSFAANGAIPPYKPFNIAGIFPIEATPILETAVSTVAEVAQGVIFGSGEKEIILPNTGAQLLETITLAPLNSVPSSSEAIARKVFSRFSTPRSPVVFMVVSAIALIALSAYVIYRIYYRKTTSLMLREPQREPVEDLQLNDAVACNIQKRVEKKKTQLALADQNIGNVVTSVDINNQSAKQTVSSNSSVSSSPQHLIRAWRTPLGRYYGMPIFISRSDRNGASPLPQFTGFLSTTPKDSSMEHETPGPTNLSEKPLLNPSILKECSFSRFYTDQTLANAASSRSESDSSLLKKVLLNPSILKECSFSQFGTDKTLRNDVRSRSESDSSDSRTIPFTIFLQDFLREFNMPKEDGFLTPFNHSFAKSGVSFTSLSLLKSDKDKEPGLEQDVPHQTNVTTTEGSETGSIPLTSLPNIQESLGSNDTPSSHGTGSSHPPTILSTSPLDPNVMNELGVASERGPVPSQRGGRSSINEAFSSDGTESPHPPTIPSTSPADQNVTPRLSDRSRLPSMGDSSEPGRSSSNLRAQIPNWSESDKRNLYLPDDERDENICSPDSRKSSPRRQQPSSPAAAPITEPDFLQVVQNQNSGNGLPLSSRTNFSEGQDTSSTNQSGGTSARSDTNNQPLNAQNFTNDRLLDLPPLAKPQTTVTSSAALDPQEIHRFERYTPPTPRATPRESTPGHLLSGYVNRGSESARSISSGSTKFPSHGMPSSESGRTDTIVNPLRTVPASRNGTDASGVRGLHPVVSSPFLSIATSTYQSEQSTAITKVPPNPNLFYRSLQDQSSKTNVDWLSSNRDSGGVSQIADRPTSTSRQIPVHSNANTFGRQPSSKRGLGGVTQIAVNSKKPLDSFRRTVTSKEISVISNADTAARLSSSTRLSEPATKFTRSSSNWFPRTSTPFTSQLKRTPSSSNRLSGTVTKATSLSSSHFSRSSTPFLNNPFKRSPPNFNRLSGTVPEGAWMNSGRGSSSLTPVPTQPKTSLPNSDRLSRTATAITRVSSSKLPRLSIPLQTQPKRSQSADQSKNQRKISLPETVPLVNSTPLSRTATGRTERYKKTNSASAVSNKSSESVKKPWGSGITKLLENSKDPLQWVPPEELQNIPPRYRETQEKKLPGFEDMVSQRELAFGFTDKENIRRLFASIRKAMNEISQMKKCSEQLYVPKDMSKGVIERAKVLYNLEHRSH